MVVAVPVKVVYRNARFVGLVTVQVTETCTGIATATRETSVIVVVQIRSKWGGRLWSTVHAEERNRCDFLVNFTRTGTIEKEKGNEGTCYGMLYSMLATAAGFQRQQ